jgi:two-component system LytT family response regulator
MMNAVIIDDETKGIEVLRMLLESQCPNVKIVGHAEEVQEAVELINSHLPEIVFLDIEMSGESGFDILEKVKSKCYHVIFVTAHSQYAVKAFRYSVADYLLKPVDPKELKEAVEKVSLLIKEGESTAELHNIESANLTLRIPIQNRVVVIKMTDIIRLEADGAYTRIYSTGNKEFISSYNLKTFEEHLDQQLFMRVHRSSIINLYKAFQVTGEKQLHVKMTDGSDVEIARRLKNEFIATLRAKRINILS